MSVSINDEDLTFYFFSFFVIAYDQIDKFIKIKVDLISFEKQIKLGILHPV